ncbi:MAG: DUF523 domain-containing protein [Halanaerobiaceae bacterium]|jgi:uncharacterized protein YbbK (DUF523 family)|nr:DUF523 domain-containing protein [Halanaerobiaceae bacterium]
MILVSACLLGENCRYDGSNALQEELSILLEGREIKMICPEVAGGLGIPRPPAEISGGDGHDVLRRRAEVISEDGARLTDFFVSGAKEVLKGLDFEDIEFAILKARSPSCGKGEIYNGSFNGELRKGPGVTAAYLQDKGIEVFSEEEIDKIRIKLRE